MLYKKQSAIKEKLLASCGFENNTDLLFYKEKELNLKYLSYVLGKELLNRTSYIASYRNPMAMLGVGSQMIEECIDVVSSAIEKASNFYNFEISKLEKYTHMDAIFYDIAINLLKNHQNSEISIATKKFSIDTGLELCLYLGNVNQEEALELKEKLYTAANISNDKEKATPGYNLDYLYKKVFS